MLRVSTLLLCLPLTVISLTSCGDELGDSDHWDDDEEEQTYGTTGSIAVTNLVFSSTVPAMRANRVRTATDVWVHDYNAGMGLVFNVDTEGGNEFIDISLPKSLRDPIFRPGEPVRFNGDASAHSCPNDDVGVYANYDTTSVTVIKTTASHFIIESGYPDGTMTVEFDVSETEAAADEAPAPRPDPPVR